MMNALQLANVLEAVAVAAMSLVVIGWAVRAVRLDSLRQRLFVLRDELFDYASSGHISFDDPAYKLLRAHMNGLIRFAHQLTLFRLLQSVAMRAALGQIPKHDWDLSWTKALGNVHDEGVRKDLVAFHERSMHNALKHLILGSPLLLSAILVAMFFMLLGHASLVSVQGLKQLARAASKRVLVGPLDPRNVEEDALCA